MKNIYLCFFSGLVLIFSGCKSKDSETSYKTLADGSRAIHVSVDKIRFTQDSISEKFQNGEHINASISKVKKSTLRPEDFPPMRVIKAKEFGQDVYFSLDNRRLYVFKNSQYHNATIRVIEATADEAIGDVWKITSQNDGWSIRLTNTPDKEARPPENSTLGKLRKYIENELARRGAAAGCSASLTLTGEHTDTEDPLATLPEANVSEETLEDSSLRPSLSLAGCNRGGQNTQKSQTDDPIRRNVRANVSEFHQAMRVGDEARAARAVQAIRGLAGVGRAAGAAVGAAGAAVSLGLGIVDAVETARAGGTPAEVTAAAGSGTIWGAIAGTVACKEKGCSPTEQFFAFLGILLGFPAVFGPADVPLNDWEYKIIARCGSKSEDGYNIVGKVCWKRPGSPEWCEKGKVMFADDVRGGPGSNTFQGGAIKQWPDLLASYTLVGSPNCFAYTEGPTYLSEYREWLQ